MIHGNDKISDNFYTAELVHPRFLELFGARAKWYISQWQIDTAEFIRDFFNRPVIINDYMWGGKMQNRGTRPPNSTVGAYYSQHKMMMAIDFHIKGLTIDHIYNVILSNQSVFMQHGITTIESVEFTPGWIHVDGRRTNMDDMLIIAPSVTKSTGDKYLIDE